MIEKLECTCIEAYKTRKMRDPNCCACSCDHNDLVEQLAKANEKLADREAFVNELQVTQSCRDRELEQLDEKLAKANERVAELEAYKAGRESAQAASDDVVNKFAIEQQIKALDNALNSYVTAKFYPTTYAIQAFNDGVTHLYVHIQNKIEQLRKEQE